ncbi:hypothetical protein [Methylocella sp.]|uniref:hypothetical protein n=1 Tax=Methylocella sp. TaxID=1978226 RepID=UPI003783CAA2
MRPPVPEPLKRFVWDIQSMVELAEGEREILLIGRDLMSRLVAERGFLPEGFAAPGADGPRHYLLYVDGMERFCVAASVYAPGQGEKVARHPFWEICGVLGGALARRRFSQGAGALEPRGAGKRFETGAVDAVFSRDREAVEEGEAGGEGARVIRVFGGDPGKAGRVLPGAEGETPAPFHWANAGDWPPYDIFAIQTKIKD